MKTFILCLLISCFSFKTHHRISKKQIDSVLKEAMNEFKKLSGSQRILEEEPITNQSNYLIDQLQESQNTMNNLKGQDLLQDDIRRTQGWFEDISSAVEKYKDQMNKKLTEIKMSLQRPKVPMIGLGPGLNTPYTFDNYGNKMNNHPNEFEIMEQNILKQQQAAQKQGQVEDQEDENKDLLM